MGEARGEDDQGSVRVPLTDWGPRWVSGGLNFDFFLIPNCVG